MLHRDMNRIKALLIPTMAISRDNYPETLGQVCTCVCYVCALD